MSYQYEDDYEDDFDGVDHQDFLNEAEVAGILSEYHRKQMVENISGPIASLIVHSVILTLMFILIAPRSEEETPDLVVEMILEQIVEPPELPEVVPEIPEETPDEDMDVIELSDNPNPEVGEESTLEDISDDSPESEDNMETEEYLDVKPTNSVLTIPMVGGRDKAGREGALKKHGGTKIGQKSVDRGLGWLASVQQENGSWEDRPAHTGMALLVFLAHGETPLSIKYGDTVRDAIKWLHKYANSSDMSRSRAYSHGIATYAIAEAYTMTQIPFLKTDMEKCIQRIIDGQQEGGGFDYHYKKGARWDLSV
ncbi:MAG: hypothetical protein HRT89_20575, partial [Lentisphaeria bacterium]|nr:hypothetical protein [Lentisphaeria bacterium]